MASLFYFAVQVPESSLPLEKTIWFINFDDLAGTSIAQKKASAIQSVQGYLGKIYPPNQINADIADPYDIPAPQILTGNLSNLMVTEAGDFIITEDLNQIVTEG
jgi:hypothetical protein